MGWRRRGDARPGLRAEVVPGLGVVLLSALWAAGSLRADLFPQFGADGMAAAERQAVLYSVFAVVAAAIAVAHDVAFPRGRRAWACAGIGLGFFVVPAALAAFAQGWISTLDRVAAFSLTPVFAVVLEPHLQGDTPRRGKAALAGALVAFAGILCIFPLDIPGSLRAGVALCALLTAAVGIAATNCLGVRLAHELAGDSTLPMAALAGAASAVCFGAAAVLTPHSAWRWSALPGELAWIFAIDLPGLFLLFWLMRRLAAARMTARFGMAPLFTILAGLALEPMSPPGRAWLGMALLAGGAGWLVFAPAERSDAEELNPLNGLLGDAVRHGK